VNRPAVGYPRHMGVVNRRNALLGWVVWTTTKSMAKQKARSAVTSDGSRLPNKRAIAAGIAAATGALLLLKSRAGSVDEN